MTDPNGAAPRRILAVAASNVRTVVLRVTDAGHLEHRWLPAHDGDPGWSPWMRAPFDGQVSDAAALSGWPRQIEIFVLDADGGVWNRWWWDNRGWEPSHDFSYRGRPFAGPAAGIAALSAGGGHFNVFVTSHDGRVAMLPHVNSFDQKWRPCPGDTDLQDGWWPAFDYTGDDIAYRTR